MAAEGLSLAPRRRGDHHALADRWRRRRPHRRRHRRSRDPRSRGRPHRRRADAAGAPARRHGAPDGGLAPARRGRRGGPRWCWRRRSRPHPAPTTTTRAISSGGSTTMRCRRCARASSPCARVAIATCASSPSTEVDAYYQLATSDLSAPFPQLVSRLPHVLDVSFAARRTRVGRGVMVELEATLTVGGDWRGATVRAGPSFGELSTVARLVDGATVARWLVPPDTGQAVRDRTRHRGRARRPALPCDLDAGGRHPAGRAHQFRAHRGRRRHPRL